MRENFTFLARNVADVLQKAPSLTDTMQKAPSPGIEPGSHRNSVPSTSRACARVSHVRPAFCNAFLESDVS